LGISSQAGFEFAPTAHPVQCIGTSALHFDADQLTLDGGALLPPIDTIEELKERVLRNQAAQRA
jgi:hypothetical protein